MPRRNQPQTSARDEEYVLSQCVREACNDDGRQALLLNGLPLACQLLTNCRMRPRVLIIGLVAIPLSSWSCEPIVPLVQLLSGSSVVGALLFYQSVFWLAAAVALKSGAFAFFERRLPWRKAVLFMLLANVVSTIPGVLLAMFAGSMSAAFLAVPLVSILGAFIGRRIAQGLPPDQKKPWINGWTVTLSFIAFFVLSVITFQSTQEALSTRNYAMHWLFKFLFVTAVAITGIVISAALEESVVAKLAEKSHGKAFFYRSVVRANYVTLALVLLVAAIQILPQRLKSPHFLASWLQSFMGMS